MAKLTAAPALQWFGPSWHNRWKLGHDEEEDKEQVEEAGDEEEQEAEIDEDHDDGKEDMNEEEEVQQLASFLFSPCAASKVANESLDVGVGVETEVAGGAGAQVDVCAAVKAMPFPLRRDAAACWVSLEGAAVSDVPWTRKTIGGKALRLQPSFRQRGQRSSAKRDPLPPRGPQREYNSCGSGVGVGYWRRAAHLRGLERRRGRGPRQKMDAHVSCELDSAGNCNSSLPQNARKWSVRREKLDIFILRASLRSQSGLGTSGHTSSTSTLPDCVLFGLALLRYLVMMCYHGQENKFLFRGRRVSQTDSLSRVSLCMSALKMRVLPVVAPSRTWKRRPGCCKWVSRRRLTVSRRHNRVLGEDRLRRARDACKHRRVVRLLRRRTREHLDELKKVFRGAEGKRLRFQDEREIMSTSTTAPTSSLGEDRITDLETFVPAAEHVDERAVPRKCSSKNFQGPDESMASSSMGVPAVPEVKEVRAPRRHRRVRFASAHSCCGPEATCKSLSVAGLDQSNSQARRTFTVEVLGLSGRLGCLARSIGVSGHVRQILLIACRSLHCLPRQLKIVLGAREIDARDDSLIDMAASEAMQRSRQGVVHVSVFRCSRLTACCTHRVWCSWKEVVLMPPLCGDSSDSGDGAMPADAEATYLSSSDDDRCSSSSSDFCLSSCRDLAPDFFYRDRAAACTVSTSGGVQRQPGGSFSLFPR